MTKEQKAVLRAAKRWWRSLRPVRYPGEPPFGEMAHLKNPTINVTCDSDERLARVVARMVLKEKTNA